MKKAAFILYIAISVAIGQGCNKILDVENIAAFDPNVVWNDAQLANAYLADLYARTMPSGWPVNNGQYADELVGNLGAGDVTPQNDAFKVWPYGTIRNINILLDEIDKGALTDEVKDPIKGQAYFLRAWNYFNMVAMHGGVPIIEKPLGLTDELMVTRNSTKECFDFIEADILRGMELVENQYTGDNRGRADKASMKAFLGRVLLFRASPQFHPDNPYTNQDWPRAYEATKAAKDELAAWGYQLIDDYSAIWDKDNKGNPEAVLSVVFRRPNKMNGRQEDGARPLSESKNSTGLDQPIWEQVAIFPMKDGYLPGSSPNYNYDLQTYWENRDPRFEASLVYNGDIFELSNKAGRRQYTANNIATREDMFGPGQLYNRSGFYPRKGLDPTLLQASVNENETDWIEIRYAEVLMNFAEAANETDHPAEALQVLREIRQRAGIEPGPMDHYGLPAVMNKEEIREAIYHEKRIEFMFEGHRFRDLRRARKLDEVDGMSKHGLLAELKPGEDPTDGALNLLTPDDFTYSVIPLLSNGTNLMSLPTTYYFFPLSRNELDKNPNLEQNSGWEGGTFNPTLD